MLSFLLADNLKSFLFTTYHSRQPAATNIIYFYLLLFFLQLDHLEII